MPGKCRLAQGSDCSPLWPGSSREGSPSGALEREGPRRSEAPPGEGARRGGPRGAAGITGGAPLTFRPGRPVGAAGVRGVPCKGGGARGRISRWVGEGGEAGGGRHPAAPFPPGASGDPRRSATGLRCPPTPFLTWAGEAEPGQGAEGGQQKGVHGEAGLLRALLSPRPARRPLYTPPSRLGHRRGGVAASAASSSSSAGSRGRCGKPARLRAREGWKRGGGAPPSSFG